MSYNPELRRQTPLLKRLRADIAANGPIPVSQYMRACLTDAKAGYYRSSEVLGRHGDFITAPEISQTFGELVGLWCLAVWQQMGRPNQLQLVELGAGRGTLLQDALRATSRWPAFQEALSLSILEINPRLRQQQAAALDAFALKPAWISTLTELQPQPTILIANEFLDCLPIEQFIAAPGPAARWSPRTIELDQSGQLRFSSNTDQSEIASLTKLPASAAELLARHPPLPGTILEWRNYADTELAALRDIVFAKDTQRAAPFAGLFLDYGHTNTAAGDTLQAVRGHAFEHPLTSPGEADLSAGVDFEQFAATMQHMGFAIDGPVTQAEFLARLGIIERAQQLMQKNPKHAAEVETAVARLLAPSGMGGRFQVLSVRTPDLAPLPGLTP